MAKLTKTSVFKAQGANVETPMDKTTRIVRKMVDEEAAKRQVKMDRLRNARLERDTKRLLEALGRGKGGRCRRP